MAVASQRFEPAAEVQCDTGDDQGNKREASEILVSNHCASARRVAWPCSVGLVVEPQRSIDLIFLPSRDQRNRDTNVNTTVATALN